jgi:hypothetical protein
MTFSIFTIATLFIHLRFQVKKRRNQVAASLKFPIRNILFEWELRSTFPRSNPKEGSLFDYSKSVLSYIDLIITKRLEDNLASQVNAIRIRYHDRNEPFDLHVPLPSQDIPPERQPEKGITHAGLHYHSIPSATVNINETLHVLEEDKSFIESQEQRSRILYDGHVDLSGQPAHPDIIQIIHERFPHLESHLDAYCRPPSFGPQAFRDFNRPTPDPSPPSPQRHEDIMELARSTFNIKPYRPLHFVDALAADTPLTTSSSYYSKFDPHVRIFARYSAPMRYIDKPTSKGYSINVTLNRFRKEFHDIKYTTRPFPYSHSDPAQDEEQMQEWFSRHPSQLFIRTQISLRDPSESKKIRPVYSVDERFLHIEKTLVTPMLAQMRNPQCCVAHGLETFRGAMSFLDKLALSFTSFISLDWSQYDQRLPRYAISAFFLDFLPSLLIISDGYMPSRGYHDTSQPINQFAKKIFNTMIFLYVWYLSMTFLSFDGFAYIRQHGGVPSGLLITQLIDSFGNMYIILDCLLEFGFTKQECSHMMFFVLGDDNLIFSTMTMERLHSFMAFLDEYAHTRHGMVVSILKSVCTRLRSKITFLSYENSYGFPTRPIGKLVAQLAFPERPIKPEREWIHAARALGLAYASCGQDSSFHELCHLVYLKFKPNKPVSSHHLRKTFKKWQYQLPTEFQIEETEYTFPPFPTLHAIRDNVKDYHGPMSENDKWNYNVFNVPPSDNLQDFVTLKDHINDTPEMHSLVNEFWQGKRSY